MLLSRRSFFFGIGATLAVIRTPGLIMPIKPFLITPSGLWVEPGLYARTAPAEVHFHGATSFEQLYRVHDGDKVGEYKRLADLGVAIRFQPRI